MQIDDTKQQANCKVAKQFYLQIKILTQLIYYMYCKTKIKLIKLFSVTIFLCLLFILVNNNCMAQQKVNMVRLAKIKVDTLQIENYNKALKIQMATAVKKEPGVLTYYAVSDKKDASIITILEIYADTAAYKLHIETPHFKKYKQTVKNMVVSLELIDVNLIGAANKIIK